MKYVLCALSIALTLLVSGCATIFGDNVKTVKVNSHPSNAQVFANNVPVGTTPLMVSVRDTWSPTMLTFKKRGYLDQNAQVNTAFQPVGLFNILFWPGFVIDAISGDMKKVTPDSRNIDVNLSKPV
jgi:hypothetical protein